MKYIVGAVALLAVCGPVQAHGPAHNSNEAYLPPIFVSPRPMAPGQQNVATAHAHEVWLVDQSNSSGKTFGGAIHVYDGEELRRSAQTAKSERIDLGSKASELCRLNTGANPVRPHMLTFNATQTHAILSFVASGHVLLIDAKTRRPVDCVRTELGAGNFRQAHAVWPSPDDKYVLVANQNGKKFERIATDYRSGRLHQEPAATLDLANCTTPNHLPCQEPTLRPDTAPICPFIPSSGFPAYVSLRGGGMFAVDYKATPMRIIAEYDAMTIPRDGCGFVEVNGWVFGNGGGGNAANLDGWYHYRVPVAGPLTYTAANPPNYPAPQVIAHDSRSSRDAHGTTRTGHGQYKYVWFFDRLANVVEVFRADTGTYVQTVNIADPSISADPTPDLIAESPDRRFVYASLRGPNPLSGDPHASLGSTPGLLVIEVLEDGRGLAVRGLAPISNRDAGGIERADGHGVQWRRK